MRSFGIMLVILLTVVIGAMVTIYDAVTGTKLVIPAQTDLQNMIGAASETASATLAIARLLDPDRRLLWLGALFILSVYFFPDGFVARRRAVRWPVNVRAATAHL